ncbi:hypothetical protein [Streptococcus dentiloxodontae]
MKKKLLVIAGVVTCIMLEYVYLLFVTAGKAVVDLKLNLTTAILSQEIKETAKHPIHAMLEYFTDKNWFFIIGMIAILLGMVFLTVKRIKELDKEWESSDGGTHGTAKWGSFKSLVKDGNFKYKTEKQFFNEWRESLK